MPIQFKSKLSSVVANATFLDKTIDDIKKGKLALYKTTIGEPEQIDDVQVYINELADVDGVAGEGDALSKTYSSEEIVANGDNRKVAIGKLDAALKLLTDDVALGAFKLISYISDSAYELAKGAPVGGEVYYNTTSGKARYYDGIELNWKVIGDQVVGIQELIGTGNGSNLDFTITNAPINDESLNVFVNGVLAYKDEYSISLPTVSFVNAPSLGASVYVSYLSNGTPASPIISAGTNNVIYLVTNPTDITNKFKPLPSTPSEPTKILADIVGGTTLYYGEDFSIIGLNFNWSGLTLDGLISSGDIIRVQYFN